MQDNYKQFENRKQAHIELALMETNQARELNRLDSIQLIHEALPDVNFNEINIASVRFKKQIPTPFFVSSMTAGHHQSIHINQILMEACAQTGWAMGVGSQRRELTDADAANEWRVLRVNFPQVTLFGNLGIAQIINTPIATIQKLIDSLEAAALIIHCNPLQEAIQPEGTTAFKGCWDALNTLSNALPVPLIVKETGCGFSSSTLERLDALNIAAVDISGLGGTHWGRIEGHRATANSLQHKAALTFRNWGISTLESLRHAIAINPRYEIWASGGVRDGLDAARLFALGATAVGFAKPMLNAALEGVQSLLNLMHQIEFELKISMFCTGSLFLDDLKEKYVIE